MVEDRKQIVKGRLRDYWDKLARENPNANWGASTSELRRTEAILEDRIVEYAQGNCDLKDLKPYVQAWGAAVVENRRG